MSVPAAWLAGIDALGMVLLHFLWQGAALGLLYVLLRSLCSTVAARYRLGLGFQLALLLCPILTAIRIWPAAEVAADSAIFSGTTLVAAAGQSVQHWHLHVALPWLVAVWVCGVLFLAARSLWQWHKLQTLLRTAQSPGAQWQECLIRLCQRFGLRRRVRLLCSARAITPMLIGWIKPAILLPASLVSGFPPQQVELIIAHELAHVRRWDYLANLFQMVVETVLFYHPVVHWIGGDVRDAREECCDDLVLHTSSSGSALPYARALAGLEELRLDLGAVAPALGADGGVLIARIRRIVGETAMAQPAPRNYVVPLLLVAVALTAMAWKAQQRASDFAAAMQRLSAQALALVSGNPHLTVPTDFSVALPAPEVMSRTPTLTLPTATDALAEDENVRIDRPPMAMVAHDALVRIGDIVAVNRVVSEEAQALEPSPAVGSVPLHVVAPAYPPRAMEGGIEGRVDLSYRIDADGRVVGIRVVSAQPSGMFEQAAKAALAAWRFPTRAAGEEHIQNFAFSLHRRGSADPCQSQTGTMICRRAGE